MDELATTLSSWAWPSGLASLREKSAALLLELSRGPGSLYSQVVHDPPDPLIHPECAWDAEVRIGDRLCIAERAFLRERRRKMKKAFAELMSVDESEIDEKDIPVVAIAGSGGGEFLLIRSCVFLTKKIIHFIGFRAMMNTTGSLIGARNSGLLDCITYISGISGQYSVLFENNI